MEWQVPLKRQALLTGLGAGSSPGKQVISQHYRVTANVSIGKTQKPGVLSSQPLQGVAQVVSAQVGPHSAASRV